MVHCDDRVIAGLGDVLQAGDFEPVKSPENDGEKIIEPTRRQRAGDDHGDHEIGDADQYEQERVVEAKLLQHCKYDRAADHEGGIEHVDGGDDAGAVIRAGPGLHRAECRHDEQAARKCESGKIDGDVDAVARGKEFADAERVCGRRHR